MHNDSTIYFWRLLGYQFIILKTDKGKEKNICFAFPLQTVIQAKQMVDEGMFFFLEESKLTNAEGTMELENQLFANGMFHLGNGINVCWNSQGTDWCGTVHWVVQGCLWLRRDPKNQENSLTPPGLVLISKWQMTNATGRERLRRETPSCRARIQRSLKLRTEHEHWEKPSRTSGCMLSRR